MGDGYPSDWDSRRKEVYSRDNYECQNCGAKGGSRGNAELHAHHMVPISNGGVHELSNLKTFCKQCHNAIHGDVDAPTKRSQTQTKHDVFTNTKKERKVHKESLLKDLSTTEVTRPWETDNDVSDWYLSYKNENSYEITTSDYIIILGFALVLLVSSYVWAVYGEATGIKLYLTLCVLYVLSVHSFKVYF